MLIIGCRLSGPGSPVIRLQGSAARCGSCDTVVYPNLKVLRNHNIVNHGEWSAWYSRDLEVIVHLCGEEDSLEQAFEWESAELADGKGYGRIPY